MDVKTIYQGKDIELAINNLAADILAKHSQKPVIIGIRRGGVFIAERLKKIIEKKINSPIEYGLIDINLYRDDWTLARELPKVGKTEISFSIAGKRVILCDDVLFTGRTVRAALEALADFGRSSMVELVVLVDRGLREMPIEANYCAFKVPTSQKQQVNVLLTEQGYDDDRVVLETC